MFLTIEYLKGADKYTYIKNKRRDILIYKKDDKL